MVNVQDCGCPCEDNGKKKRIEERALSSINKVYTTEGATYFPDGTGMVTLPLPTAKQIQQIGENSERLTVDEETLRQLKISDAENVEAIAQAQRDISAHAEEIGDIKATDAQQDAKIKTAEGEIDALKTLTDSITKSLITDVEVRDGAGSGTFLVELTEEDGTKRTSDTYQYGQVGSFELIQGTEAGYVRGRLTLTNGVVKESNDYQILQLVESDVYVTAITLTPDYTAGKLGGEIGYSNGNKAQIDPVLVPTAPGVTSNIDALLKRMTSAETVDKEQTAKIANLETRVKAIEDTPGVGQFAAGKLGTIKGGTADGSVQAQEDGTGAVVGWSGKADKTALDATDAEVAKKANQADLTALTSATGKAFGGFEVAPTADRVTITMTGIDGMTSVSQDLPIASDSQAGVVTPELLGSASQLMTTLDIFLDLEASDIGNSIAKPSSTTSIWYDPAKNYTLALTDLLGTGFINANGVPQIHVPLLNVLYKNPSPSSLTIASTNDLSASGVTKIKAALSKLPKIFNYGIEILCMTDKNQIISIWDHNEKFTFNPRTNVIAWGDSKPRLYNNPSKILLSIVDIQMINE